MFGFTAIAALFGGVTAFGLAPDTVLETVPTIPFTRELKPPISALTENPTFDAYWREERIARGDTIGSVLARLGVSDPAAEQFLRSDAGARPLYQLRPGKPVRVETNDDGALLALRYLTASGDLLAVDYRNDHYQARSIAAPVSTQFGMATGEISSSLFGAADAAGLPDPITLQLVDIFSGDIDFYHDLRRGDRFNVVYELKVIDGEVIGSGRIVAAEFVNRGTVYRAFYWAQSGENGGYYSEDGKSLRAAFLRSPMEFSRITSGFSVARFHPILRTWRAHRGVDYAAPTGTPVRATGDGKVVFAGWQGGYGNIVVVAHQGVFSTAYAHLSRFSASARPGAHVAQGEVIGYVGQTGWATGPHLHYEFRVNDEQRDPLKLALPSAQPIPVDQKASFAAAVAAFADRIALLRRMTVAAAR